MLVMGTGRVEYRMGGILMKIRARFLNGTFEVKLNLHILRQESATKALRLKGPLGESKEVMPLCDSS